MQGLAWQTRTEKSGAPDAGVVTITEFEKGEEVSTRQLRRLKGAFLRYNIRVSIECYRKIYEGYGQQV